MAQPPPKSEFLRLAEAYWKRAVKDAKAYHDEARQAGADLKDAFENGAGHVVMVHLENCKTLACKRALEATSKSDRAWISVVNARRREILNYAENLVAPSASDAAGDVMASRDGDESSGEESSGEESSGDESTGEESPEEESSGEESSEEGSSEEGSPEDEASEYEPSEEEKLPEEVILLQDIAQASIARIKKRAAAAAQKSINNEAAPATGALEKLTPKEIIHTTIVKLRAMKNASAAARVAAAANERPAKRLASLAKLDSTLDHGDDGNDVGHTPVNTKLPKPRIKLHNTRVTKESIANQDDDAGGVDQVEVDPSAETAKPKRIRIKIRRPSVPQDPITNHDDNSPVAVPGVADKGKEVVKAPKKRVRFLSPVASSSNNPVSLAANNPTQPVASAAKKIIKIRVPAARESTQFHGGGTAQIKPSRGKAIGGTSVRDTMSQHQANPNLIQPTMDLQKAAEARDFVRPAPPAQHEPSQQHTHRRNWAAEDAVDRAQKKSDICAFVASNAQKKYDTAIRGYADDKTLAPLLIAKQTTAAKHIAAYRELVLAERAAANDLTTSAGALSLVGSKQNVDDNKNLEQHNRYEPSLKPNSGKTQSRKRKVDKVDDEDKVIEVSAATAVVGAHDNAEERVGEYACDREIYDEEPYDSAHSEEEPENIEEDGENSNDENNVVVRTTKKSGKGKKRNMAAINLEFDLIAKRDQDIDVPAINPLVAARVPPGIRYYTLKSIADHHWVGGYDTMYTIDNLITDLAAAGGRLKRWGGQRWVSARIHMKNMKVGDLAFFYHTYTRNIQDHGPVGVVRIAKEWSPDWDAVINDNPYYDRTAPADGSEWCVVHIELVQTFPHIVTLNEMRREQRDNGVDGPLHDVGFFKNQQCPTTEIEERHWKYILGMARAKCTEAEWAASIIQPYDAETQAIVATQAELFASLSVNAQVDYAKKGDAMDLDTEGDVMDEA